MALVVIVGVAVSVRRRRRARWRARMAATVHALGLELHALEPAVRASGSHRGLELAIEGAETVRGTLSVFGTRVTVTGGNPPAAVVQRVGVGAAPARMVAVCTGDPTFDARYRVYGGAAAELLFGEPDRRAQVLAIGHRSGELLELRCGHGKVVALLSGVRLPPETLRAGVRLACGLVAG